MGRTQPMIMLLVKFRGLSGGALLSVGRLQQSGSGGRTQFNYSCLRQLSGPGFIATGISRSSATTISTFHTRHRHLSTSLSVCLSNVPRNYYSSLSDAGDSSFGSSSAKETDRPSGVPSRDGQVDIVYFRGLPQITVPLPSRRERCRFILKPLTNSVGDLLHMIQNEDKGIDRIAVLSEDGVRVAASNTIEMLMEQNFDLIINDTTYHVITPPQEKPSQEDLERLSGVRNLVGQLYAALNVDEHQLRREREMLAELERLQLELAPLEEKKQLLAQLSSKRTNILTWVGLGLMSVQFGILARLTWWEYSWDIMEPVTYFVTYGTAMLAYAYFVFTKQDYILPEVVDRQYLRIFHRNARKIGMDVERYNRIRTEVFKIESDLNRLRDPLALHLPLKNRTVANQLEFQKSQSDSSSQGIISKAQHKLQQIIQKAQQQSSPS